MSSYKTYKPESNNEKRRKEDEISSVLSWTEWEKKVLERKDLGIKKLVYERSLLVQQAILENDFVSIEHLFMLNKCMKENINGNPYLCKSILCPICRVNWSNQLYGLVGHNLTGFTLQVNKKTAEQLVDHNYNNIWGSLKSGLYRSIRDNTKNPVVLFYDIRPIKWNSTITFDVHFHGACEWSDYDNIKNNIKNVGCYLSWSGKIKNKENYFRYGAKLGPIDTKVKMNKEEKIKLFSSMLPAYVITKRPAVLINCGPISNKMKY